MTIRKATINFNLLNNKFKNNCEKTIKKFNFCIIKNYLNTSQFSLSKKKIFKKFSKMNHIRNFLLEIPLKKKIFFHNKNKYFASNRIMYYKTGNGFLESHYDTTAGDFTKQKYGKYYQVLTTITEKEKDYKTGGGFIFLNNKKVNIDDHISNGDILIYNEKLKHGVDKIYFKSKKKNSGRISILVTFYKNLIKSR